MKGNALAGSFLLWLLRVPALQPLALQRPLARLAHASCLLHLDKEEDSYGACAEVCI